MALNATSPEHQMQSLQEQKVVASILRDLDDIIEVNNEINNNLQYDKPRFIELLAV